MIGSELIGVLDESSYNLNTSPWTVTITDGDLYDFHFFAFVDSGTGTGGNLNITLNSDTGTNYNTYLMSGYTTTAIASVSTGGTSISLGDFARWSSGRNGLAMGSLTGESGANRKFSVEYCEGFPQRQVKDHYWTNTADPIDEITFTGSVSASYKWHIEVYRVPKESDQGSWEYMKELSWSSETTEKSFSSLDGDTDIQYMIQWDGDQDIQVQCNNDGGTNYLRQLLYNNNGTITSLNQTNLTSSSGSDQTIFIINAESGVDRLIYLSSSQASISQQVQQVSYWQNTADNLTSLDCTPSASATGTAKLFRRVNPSITSEPLPFETIKTFEVSGDYSAGDTLSGLTCDDYKMIKIEWLGKNTSGQTNISFTLNNDTGSNYYRQFLRGYSSTTQAQAGTTSLKDIAVCKDAHTTYGVVYLYPKSGEYRPSLNTMMLDEGEVRFSAQWWLNSADEITSIETFALNTNSLSGQIRISVLR